MNQMGLDVELSPWEDSNLYDYPGVPSSQLALAPLQLVESDKGGAFILPYTPKHVSSFLSL